MNNKKLLLILIILVGFVLRIYNINWDNACCQHPDERAIVMFALPISLPQSIEEFLSPESPLNPHFFAYGNFPLYILKGLANVASMVDPIFLTYSKMNIIGRLISVFSDLVTLILVFLIARKIFNLKIAYASALIYAISVLPIQYSHFFTVDTLLTLFIALVTLRTVIFYKNPNILNTALVGIAFGLALVTKISAAPFALVIILTAFLPLVEGFSPVHALNTIPIILRRVLIVSLITFITFVCLQPYALIDFGEFLKQTMQQSEMTHSAYAFPYTLQYVGKVPYLYEIQNIFFWGLGPVITALSFIGAYTTIRRFKSRSKHQKIELLLVFLFPILLFFLVGSFAVGWMRYLLPIYPFLAILAGVAIISIVREIHEVKQKSLKFLSLTILAFMILFWPITFFSIYTRTNTRIEATTWINKNIPDGSTIAIEHWDDRIPMETSRSYQFQELTLYEYPDDDAKWDLMRDKIGSSDYIIIASNRLYVPLQKLNPCGKYERCYPKTSKYYQDLFSEKLGFKKIAEFASYPTIPFTNIRINDQTADESFTVYDHPKIMIFQKTKL